MIIPKIEMELLASLVNEDGYFLINQDGDNLAANGWQEMTHDVIAGSLSWSRGNSGRSIFDRVANIGTLSFALNNSGQNESGILGYYSPDNPNHAPRFGLDTRVRLSLYDGAMWHEEWQGRISSISPAAGRYRERRTEIICEDWMANAYRDIIRGVTVQQNKRDDEILTTLLSLASIPPAQVNFDVGDDIYSYALHDENSLSSTIARIMQKLAMSGLGRITMTGYDTLKYISRSALLTSGTPAASLSDNDLHEIGVSRTKSQRVREVIVTTYPVEIDAAPAVLWEAQREIQIAAGETIEFDISLRDPSGRATRVAAISIIPPAADTDYKFSSTTGSGNDLNGSLSISAELKADIVVVRLTNNAAITGYLWHHQQRGYGAYLYEPVSVRAETGMRDGDVLEIDMIYQDDQYVGKDMADLLRTWYSVDQSDIESVVFFSRDARLTSAALLQCGEYVTVAETITGINAGYIINGYNKELLPNGIIKATWYLVPANQLENVWVLGLVGASELDATTYLTA